MASRSNENWKGENIFFASLLLNIVNIFIALAYANLAFNFSLIGLSQIR
jgi:hypothetical protein